MHRNNIQPHSDQDDEHMHLMEEGSRQQAIPSSTVNLHAVQNKSISHVTEMRGATKLDQLCANNLNMANYDTQPA